MYRQRNRLITRYRGLSTDDKPQSADHGSQFHEMDTGTVYFFDKAGGEWHESPGDVKSEEKTVTGNPITVTDALAAKVKSLSVVLEPIQSGSGNPSPDNIRPISGRTEVNVWREAAYDTSADPALTITLGQTVYGCHYNLVSGEMVVDRAMITPKSVNSVNVGQDGVVVCIIDIQNNPSPANNKGELLSNQFFVGNPLVYPGHCYFTYYGTYLVFCPIDQTLNTKALVNAWLQANEVQFCYELAEPITLTLTSQQLKLLKETNNVWSDGNNITMTYKAKKGT